MGLAQIVNVQISRNTQGVTRAGFGIPLILGPNAAFSGVRTYASLSAVNADFATSTPEYKIANALLSQTLRPRVVKIRGTAAAVAQVDTLTPSTTLQAIQAFTVKINGTTYSFTSDANPTAAEVVTGLNALINADANQPVTATGTSTIILTADQAGESFLVEPVTSNITRAATTPNAGIASDILSAAQQDSDWYALFLAATTDLAQLEAAKTIEGMEKILLIRRDDANIRTAATTDIASKLKDKNYFRTALWYSGTLSDMLEAGVAGGVLPLDAGSESWAYKQVAGVTVDRWTDAEEAYIEGKNANWFSPVGGLNVTRNGKMAGGEWIDIIRGIDWIRARVREAVFGLLVRSVKVPFTDQGIASVEAEVRGVLIKANRLKIVDDDFDVEVPKVLDVDINARAARTLEGVTFTARMTGAIHSVEIFGTVSV